MAEDVQERAGIQTCLDCGSENAASESVCTTCGASLDTSAARALIGMVVLGSYEIVDILGQGGMSVVYKARHKLTDQIVALKILPPELAVHGGLRARFLEEAKALARLEHPNIVRLYHFGEETGRFVLAMQFVEGATFERKIFRSKKLPWREAVGITCEVLRALEYAHARGVVHRDIKPSNVIVRGDSTAMVMDFGIAKITAESSRLTATGQTMGTVRYMSPEQVRGQVVDFHSDLYSVGCGLYEGVVGDTPYDGNTHFEIMNKHLTEPPPAARDHGAEIPEELDDAMIRAMQKEPDKRWPSAREFREALERVLALPEQDYGGSAISLDTPRARRNQAAGASPELVATRDMDSRVTGIASSLEPAIDDSVSLKRRRPLLWIGLGGLVAAASAVVLVVLLQGSRSAARASDGGPTPPAWPEPPMLPGLVPVVDEKLDGVRVIAARQLDAKRLAVEYGKARQRFETYLRRKGIADAIDVPPVNLIVVPKDLLCAPRLYGGRAVPADCAEIFPHRYLVAERTLYVKDDERLESVNLTTATSEHICFWTEKLLELGCLTVLDGYWNEVEKEGAP